MCRPYLCFANLCIQISRFFFSIEEGSFSSSFVKSKKRKVLLLGFSFQNINGLNLRPIKAVFSYLSFFFTLLTYSPTSLLNYCDSPTLSVQVHRVDRSLFKLFVLHFFFRSSEKCPNLLSTMSTTTTTIMKIPLVMTTTTTLM